MNDITESMKQFIEIAFYITIGAAVRVMHYAKKHTIDKKMSNYHFYFCRFCGCYCQSFINIKRSRKI
jgi:hypothetical protein